jgi:AraC-like DNA-binding protein
MNADPRQTLIIALLLVAAGAMLATAAGIWRAQQPAVRWTGVAFDLSGAGYAIKLWNDETGFFSHAAALPILVLSFGAVGWFWLFVLTLFEDRKSIRPALLLPVVGLILLGLSYAYLRPPGGKWLMALSCFAHIAMALHILTVVTRSWNGDLVEVRRQLRGPFVVVVTLYIIALSLADLWEGFVAPLPMFSLFNSIILTAISLAGAFVFIDARDELFGAGTTSAVTSPQPGITRTASGGNRPAGNLLDRAARADLDRLDRLIKTEEVWREEGLTIASLAVRVNMPEAHLRRLINDHLGYRNFPSFVNAHRIRAAMVRLADPNEARTSISVIAFDIGFASLGPFNRAFKEETGQSPSEWRRHALNQPQAASAAG